MRSIASKKDKPTLQTSFDIRGGNGHKNLFHSQPCSPSYQMLAGAPKPNRSVVGRYYFSVSGFQYSKLVLFQYGIRTIQIIDKAIPDKI